MKVLYKEDVPAHKAKLLGAIRDGRIIVYPTDTIYGIGCDATNTEAIARLRTLKGRPYDKPFSVIAPSKEWITQNCEVADDRLLNRLPGPYTFIFKKMGTSTVSKAINQTDGTLGVRIPAHWFSDFVSELGVPLVTTSVNFSGSKYMVRLGDIPKDFEDSIEYVIYEGEKKGKPSEKFDYAHGEAPGVSIRIPPITPA